MGWIRATAWSVTATLVAMALMFWARGAFQIRTVPERVMEALLLFVPPAAFERAIQSFGPLAKVLALHGAIAVTTASLLCLGVFSLRRRLLGEAILGLAALLYLLTMAGIMPLTGAGLFGADLRQHPILVNGSYLGVSLAYATVLLLGQALSPPSAPAGPRRATFGARRALVVLAAGVLCTAGAYAVTVRQAAVGAIAGSDLPLAELPSDLVGGGPAGGQPASGRSTPRAPTHSVAGR
jgi:hypothetical protein